MDQAAAYGYLGRLIVQFQLVEASLTELLVLMANADDEIVRILVNELEFSGRVKATDVAFARFIGVRTIPDRETVQREFHTLMTQLQRLGERRNDIVHSRYWIWTSADGASGLLRQNSKLRAKIGERVEEEEEVLEKSFDEDFRRLSSSLMRLEEFRLQIIEWQ